MKCRRLNHQVNRVLSDRGMGRLALRLGMVVLIGFSLLACDRKPDASSSAVESSTSGVGAKTEEVVETRVFLTHPSRKTLRDFAFLVENRILEIPGLKLTALFHRGAGAPFQKAQDYVRTRKRAWMDVRKLDCEVPEEKVFESNECVAPFRRLVEESHAIIFTGGADILPALYGEPAQLTTRATSPGRNFFEISLLYHLFAGDEGRALLDERPGYPVLAICLGMESMNVALGGTLYQDIPSELYEVDTAEDVLELPSDQQHSCYAPRTTTRVPRQHWVSHPIRFTEHWPLSAPSPGETVDVLSAHHQAVDRLGRGLQVAATSLDGKVVEALTHGRFENVLGIQFHPEYGRGWTAQRRCTNTVEDEPGSNYQLNGEMAAFYGEFWKAFGAQVSSQARRKRSHAVTTGAKLTRTQGQAGREHAKRESN